MCIVGHLPHVAAVHWLCDEVSVFTLRLSRGGHTQVTNDRAYLYHRCAELRDLFLEAIAGCRRHESSSISFGHTLRRHADYCRETGANDVPSVHRRQLRFCENREKLWREIRRVEDA